MASRIDFYGLCAIKIVVGFGEKTIGHGALTPLFHPAEKLLDRHGIQDVFRLHPPAPSGNDTKARQIEFFDTMSICVNRQHDAEFYRSAGILCFEVEAVRISVDFERGSMFFRRSKDRVHVEV